MITLVEVKKYRNDIDALRAIAVLAVIVFHFGRLPNGFLGVDVFFVISGFLITGLIYKEITNDRFSIINFYLRRIRRILPLALLVSLVALMAGIATMLPDDMENLAQSVIATNLFANNILQTITTRNYFDVVNEYKPLMHTWSLGVEEQYCFFYPLLFMLVSSKKSSWLLLTISTLAAASIISYLLPFQGYKKFYFIFFRFWELAVGGVAVVALKSKLINHTYSDALVLVLIGLLCFEFPGAAKDLVLIVAVLLTLAILVSKNDNNIMLQNKVLVAVGKISFGLYMWHQVLLAYARYFLVKDLHANHLVAIFILTIILSIISYYLIEQPFRNTSKVTTRSLLLTLGIVFLLTTAISFHIYQNAGVLKDVPELDIKKSEVEGNMHAKYNARVYDYDKNFRSTDKIKILVIGNSFARDWVNVILESRYSNEVEVSYVYNPYDNKSFKDRVEKSDIIFYSTPESEKVRKLELPVAKLWVVGTKNFGTSNGIFYNYKGDDYYEQRTSMEMGYLEKNSIMLHVWGNKYIDYIGKVIDSDNTVPVFTPSRKFISQDCRHFTKAGAQYFAQLFEHELKVIILRKPPALPG